MNIEQARFNMVEQQIRPWNVFDENVLSSLMMVKRENFVNSEYQNISLADVEIPLPGGQKMLCPRIEARLLQELELCKMDKVLEIGTGSGYLTALIAKLADFVYSIELNAQNKEFAVMNLTKNGIKNATVIEGDGTLGLAAKAPFDKILIGGSLDAVPEVLKQQLKIGGIMTAVVGVKSQMASVTIKRISETQFQEAKNFETVVDRLITQDSQIDFKL